MAAASKRSEKSGISWINSVTEEEQNLAFVSGVDGEVRSGTSFKIASGSKGKYNKKGTKTQIKRITESKTPPVQKTTSKKKVVLQNDQPEAYYQEEMFNHRTTLSSDSTDSFMPFSQVGSDNCRPKSDVCLKDLCPEDKRRIANLIEELARVTEEKEESMLRLKNEQGSAERKIQQLEEQNLTIAQERESLQQQYKECQELLALYQQYLLMQQARVNQSIQITSQPATNKVLSGEENHSRTAVSRANGTLFDGSYLTCGATEAQQSQAYTNNDGRRGATHAFQNPGSLCFASDLSPNCRQFKQHVQPKRECREPHICGRCEHSQNGVYDTSCEMHRHRSNAHQWNGNSYIHNKEEIARHHRDLPRIEAKEAPTLLSQLSHEDWEEKKHQILLQKMQLEMERENIQIRLAEQEERLRRENQLLRQSCLDTSSLQQATRAEVTKSTIKERSSEPGGSSQQHLISSVSEDDGIQPAGQIVHEKHSQTVSTLQTSNNSFKDLRRDMATSPAIPPARVTSVNAAEQTPEDRLDISSVELLDILSPVSTPPYMPATPRHKTSQRQPAVGPKSLNRTLLTPRVPFPRNSQQNLEESQILEDIFFIF